jgi:uncharacterized membrane protein
MKKGKTMGREDKKIELLKMSENEIQERKKADKIKRKTKKNLAQPSDNEKNLTRKKRSLKAIYMNIGILIIVVLVEAGSLTKRIPTLFATLVIVILVVISLIISRETQKRNLH